MPRSEGKPAVFSEGTLAHSVKANLWFAVVVNFRGVGQSPPIRKLKIDYRERKKCAVRRVKGRKERRTKSEKRKVVDRFDSSLFKIQSNPL